MTQIKIPAVYDTSHWKIVPDFALVDPRPVLVLTKATEHISYVDNTFVPYFADLQQDGIARGCYHFFRKNYDPVKQALHFIKTIEFHVTDNDILVLDVEEDGETAARMWAWFETVKRAFPNNLLMLYSRKNILDPIKMTLAEKEYFKKIPIWTAGYPYFPDLYSKTPSGYIPDQSKYGVVWLWQYTDSGHITGISGDTDCNYIDPMLHAIIQNMPVVIPPEGEDMTTYYLTATGDPTKVFADAGGTSPIAQIQKGKTFTSRAKTTNTYYITAPQVGYVKFTQVKLDKTVEDTPPVDPPPDPDPTTTLPAIIESTQVLKDAAGVVLATYTGTLTKQ